MKVFLLHVGFEVSLAYRNMRDFARLDPEIHDGVEFILREFRTEEFANEGLRVNDFAPFSPTERTLLEVARLQPDVLALSCYIWNTRALLVFAERVRQMSPSTLIVAGGPDVAYQAERVLARWPALDVIVSGEGEEIFRDLLKVLLSGSRDGLATLGGTTVRMPDGAVVTNCMRDPIAKLDDIPAPYVDELESDAPALKRFDNSLIYETIRGCVYHCAFCLYGKGFFKYRYYDETRCVTDLARLLDKGFTVQVVDPIFGLNRNRTKRILTRLTEVERPGQLIIESYAELVDDEVAALFKKARVTQIGIGLQSIGPAAILEMDRRFNRERWIAGANALSANGLGYYVDVIYGLPGDTYQSFLDTIDFALSCSNADLEIYRLLALPGTRYFEEAAKYGLRYSPESPYETYGCDTFPYEDVMRAHTIAHTYKLVRTAIGKVQKLAPIWRKAYRNSPSAFLTDLAGHLQAKNAFDFFNTSAMADARFVISRLFNEFLVQRGLVATASEAVPAP